jgi:futalosine hydrolase
MVLFLSMIYILYPTVAEISPFAEMLEGRLFVETCKRTGFTGLIAERPVTALVSGVGQVNTAQTTAALMEGGNAELLVMGGCAGAYGGSGLSVGDVAVATEEIYADLGVITKDGWLDMEDVGQPTRFPLMPERFESQMAKVSRVLPRPPVFGPFLTVSTVSGTKARGDTLRKRFGGICENMEGAAAAQVSLMYGVPFVEVRGISNMVTDRDRESWDIEAAAAGCALAIRDFLR